MTISVYADPSGNYATMSIGGSEKFRLNSDGTATLDGAPVQRMLNLGTKTTTSGTAIDFSPGDGTGIPSWAKKITVMFNGVSTNGAGNYLVQLGTSGGVVTAGYANAGTFIVGSAAGTNSVVTTGVLVASSAATNAITGMTAMVSMGNNVWLSNGIVGMPGSFTLHFAGSASPGAAVTSVRITTVNGTDVFDAGSVSVLVEG